MDLKIRRAKPSDCNQILAIYRPVVEDTAISLELIPPTSEEICRRIESALSSHEWLVAEGDNGIDGYAYASEYRPREAYKYAAETTVYIHQDRRGQGLGRALYKALFQSLGSLGFRRAYAGIALPNEPSIALHRSLGFEHIGVFNEAGFKFDRWHDVSWWQRKV
jgi:L-amino acid N-acyltransferase YncA